MLLASTRRRCGTERRFEARPHPEAPLRSGEGGSRGQGRGPETPAAGSGPAPQRLSCRTGRPSSAQHAPIPVHNLRRPAGWQAPPCRQRGAARRWRRGRCLETGGRDCAAHGRGCNDSLPGAGSGLLHRPTVVPPDKGLLEAPEVPPVSPRGRLQLPAPAHHSRSDRLRAPHSERLLPSEGPAAGVASAAAAAARFSAAGTAHDCRGPPRSVAVAAAVSLPCRAGRHAPPPARPRAVCGSQRLKARSSAHAREDVALVRGRSTGDAL
mmetsp:Transcript_2718/g.10964  ORF Transcript_2718/g.10964 Transcript_2718/m.10964 type:complete len:267 (-) Transcript_2718:796-1596(-)